jgi:hypothetical protein
MGLKREERKEAVSELLKQYSSTVGEDGAGGGPGGADADAEAEADVNTRLDDVSPAETEINSGPEVTETGPPSREDADDEDLADADENQCSICLDGYGKWVVNVVQKNFASLRTSPSSFDFLLLPYLSPIQNLGTYMLLLRPHAPIVFITIVY